ncbi:MAG TPA: hypothetical protein VFI16_01760 [Anaeromyxobacteraceae bacterium]|nr:hypothetical protein [Anaeromyxobacteraceae bacterium]
MPRATLAATALALSAACAHAPPPGPAARPFPPPAGARAFGVEFGRDPRATARELSAQGVAARRDPADEDALLADRCPQAPVHGSCRLAFGPAGLYAAEVEVALAGAAGLDELRAELGRVLGAPSRGAETSAPVPGLPRLEAAWLTPEWTVTLARLEREPGAAVAMVRAEYDRAAPPVVAGVPLWRRREAVEALLERRGSVLVHAEEVASQYLACPDGSAEAQSCVVEWREGRAALVTEVYGRSADDREALVEWRQRSAALEKEAGRAPERECPPDGPDRVAGGCTATWSAERLIIVVGAHRGQGGRHRGSISVYTTWAYPPLLPSPPREPAPGTPEAAAGEANGGAGPAR